MKARYSFCTFVKNVKKNFKKMKGFQQASWNQQHVHKDTQKLYLKVPRPIKHFVC